jgi:hypothetical protein
MAASGSQASYEYSSPFPCNSEHDREPTANNDNDNDEGGQDSVHAPSSFNLQRAHDFVRQAAKQGASARVR